ETEHLVLDFMAEVFFAWWACLFRAEGGHYSPKHFRALDQTARPDPIDAAGLDAILPANMVTEGEDPAVAALAPPGSKLIVPLDAGSERLALLALGPRLNGGKYGQAERDLA